MSESLEAMLAHHPTNEDYQQTIRTLAAELTSYNPRLHYSEDGVYIYINYKNVEQLSVHGYFVVYYFYFDDESPQFAVQTFGPNPSMLDYQDIPSLLVAVRALLQ